MPFASSFALVSLCAALASATTTGDPSTSIELRAQPFEVQLFPPDCSTPRPTRRA